MTGRAAAGELRWLVLPDHKIYILKYTGDMDGPTMTTRLCAFFTAHPEAFSYASVNDLRSFIGSITYEDMVKMAEMLRPIQPPDAKRKSVLLTHDEAAVYIAHLAQDIFDWRIINVLSDPVRAFAEATDGAAMPEEVRAFMES